MEAQRKNLRLKAKLQFEKKLLSRNMMDFGLKPEVSSFLAGESSRFHPRAKAHGLPAAKIKFIAGVDEVGRGCLAGPMVVGAVILNPKHLRGLIARERLQYNDVSYLKLTDSKKLSPNKRKKLSDFILENAVSYSIKVINARTVDSKGISKCTQIGFGGAIKKLEIPPDHILTDAFAIKSLPKEVQTNIRHGDMLSISIAAASIIAKVYRDELMIKLHNSNEKYQVYGFDKHKGYGTKKHLVALEKYGPSDIHRLSFKPIKRMDLARDQI